MSASCAHIYLFFTKDMSGTVKSAPFVLIQELSKNLRLSGKVRKSFADSYHGRNHILKRSVAFSNAVTFRVGFFIS
jgi:hypothetical protein